MSNEVGIKYMTFVEQRAEFAVIHKPLKDVRETVEEAIKRVEGRGVNMTAADQNALVTRLEQAVFRARTALNAKMYQEQARSVSKLAGVTSEDKNAGLAEKVS